jgi:hypothetical protein
MQTPTEIKDAIVAAISRDRAIPSMDTCCDYAGYGEPDGPAVTWRALERLRMAAILEVMSEWYMAAADEEPYTENPFPALDIIVENDNFIDMEDLTKDLLVFADNIERNVIEVALDHMQEHLADAAKDAAPEDGIDSKSQACARLIKRLAQVR